jgi:hypothetical protein
MTYVKASIGGKRFWAMIDSMELVMMNNDEQQVPCMWFGCTVVSSQDPGYAKGDLVYLRMEQILDVLTL